MRLDKPNRRSTPRRGSFFVEAVIAMTIVFLAMIAAAQLIGLTYRQQREGEQVRIATHELANVMEQLYSTPWRELTDRNEEWLEISSGAKDNLNEPQFRVSVETTTDMIATKRCRVEATWLDQSGQRVAPIQLTAWKHRGDAP